MNFNFLPKLPKSNLDNRTLKDLKRQTSKMILNEKLTFESCSNKNISAEMYSQITQVAALKLI